MEDIKIKEIQPVYTGVLLTCEKYSDSGLLIPGTKIYDGKKTSKKGGNVKELQKVLSVGPNVHQVKVGDIVSLNLANFAVKKYVPGNISDNVEERHNETIEFRIPCIEVDGRQLILCDERDIGYIVTKWE